MFMDYQDVINLPESISGVRIRVPLILDDVELRQAAGCVGYAVKQIFGENATSEPYNVFRVAGTTTFQVDFSIPAYFPVHDDLMDTIMDYIEDGSPLRTTNRAGSNTKGTRLVEGLGVRPVVEIPLPEATSHSVEIKVDGRPVFYTIYSEWIGREGEELADVLARYARTIKGGL